MGLSWQKAQVTHPLKDPEQVTSKKEICHYLEAHQVSIGSGKTVAYFDAVNYVTGRLIVKPYSSSNSQNITQLIKEIRAIHPSQNLIVIWDSAAYHSSHNFRSYLRQVNGDKPEQECSIYCIKLAPDAPVQNPIEVVGLHVKTSLRSMWYLLKMFKMTKWLLEQFL